MTGDRIPFAFVEIEWLDSRALHEWTNLNELALEAPAVCYSRGWVVSEDVACLVLAGTYSPTIDEFAALLLIPKGCIQKRIELHSREDAR